MVLAQHVAMREWARKVWSGRMTRRGFLERAVAVGVGSGAALALLDACSSGSLTASGPTIAYWNLFGGGDGVRMVQMENDFTKAYPSINLEAMTLVWGEPYYTKLAMAAAGGRPPDVAISHMTRVPIYASSDLLEPFDLTELAKVGITQDRFLPAIWERAQYNGQLYTIPLDTHPFVLYYNVDICKKAGLLDDAGNLLPLNGPQPLMDALKKAQKVTGALGLALDTQDVMPWRLFYTLYSQLGGQVLSPDSKELVLDNSKAEEVLAFMQDLTQTSKVASPVTDYAGAVANFGNSKAGFFWDGEWEVTTFAALNNFSFNMLPFPNVYGEYHAQADSHAFVLPRQRSVDPAKRAASLTFISFMLKDSYTWAQGGHIPAYLPVANSAQYKSMKPQSNYSSAAATAVIDPIAWFSGSGSEFETQAGAAFQVVLAGQSTPQQGVAQFRAAVLKLLSIPSPL